MVRPSRRTGRYKREWKLDSTELEPEVNHKRLQWGGDSGAELCRMHLTWSGGGNQREGSMGWEDPLTHW